MATWHLFESQSAAYSRAERNLRSTQLALESIAATAGATPEIAAAQGLLKAAEESLQQHKIEHCWHFVNDSRRRLVFVKDDDERAMAAQVLLIEAHKLPEWRRKGINALVADTAAPPAAALRDALWLRDDYYENRYHRIEMQREQLSTIVLYAAVALVVILLTNATTPGRLEDVVSLAPWHWRALLIVLSFGVLGASFSAARSITVKDLGTVIPELALSRLVTRARMLLGASLGLTAYALLLTGGLNLGAPGLATAAAAAFGGGFSEQLVLKILGTPKADEKP
jgi:hypothetical protein